MLWALLTLALLLLIAPILFIVFYALTGFGSFHKMKKKDIDNYYDKPGRNNYK